MSSRSSRRWTRLLALLLAAGLVGAPAAAHAERVVTEDAAADVVNIVFGEGDDLEQSEVTPAPDATTVDITRTVVDHRPARVRVVAHYTDVRPARFRITVVQLRTPDARYTVSVLAYRGERTEVELHRKGRGTIECRGLESALDRAADRSTVVVPTACLGTPRWVEVGVGAAVVDAGREDVESMPLLVDDGHLTGKVREDGLALGPRVRRG